MQPSCAQEMLLEMESERSSIETETDSVFRLALRLGRFQSESQLNAAEAEVLRLKTLLNHCEERQRAFGESQTAQRSFRTSEGRSMQIRTGDSTRLPLQLFVSYSKRSINIPFRMAPCKSWLSQSCTSSHICTKHASIACHLSPSLLAL
eukprot:6193822-Pleurochrysis_carterae.AAC.3